MTRAVRPSLDGRWFPLVVIGGGVNGVAIARECARAGLGTLLLEQNDFACGSTSRSTRIIHGGLRYLDHGEIGLVRESLRERTRLLQQKPHLVRPLEFLLALQPGGRHSALAVRAGLWLYRRLAQQSGSAFATASSHHHAERQLEQALDSGRRLALFRYEDAQCEFPERLVAEWLREAVAAGCVARNHTSALRICCSAGRVRAVVLRDAFSGEEQRVECERIVNAAGPWADQIVERAGVSTRQPLVGGVRGSHIVVSQISGAPRSALYAEAVDGRPMFFIPWNRQLLIGTTEVPDRGDPARAQPSGDEISYLIRSANALLPSAKLTVDDVHYAFAGIRALPFEPGTTPSAVSRKHQLRDHGSEGALGMISVVGGKLTTAASLARACARKLGVRVAEPEIEIKARSGPQPAAVLDEAGLEAALLEWSRQIAQATGIGEEPARALAEWRGPRALAVAEMAMRDAALSQPLCPHTRHMVVEAVDAVEQECAVTLGDILLRRAPVALGGCWSAGCSQLASERIGKALDWSEARVQLELEEFEQERGRFLVKPTGEVEASRVAQGIA